MRQRGELLQRPVRVIVTILEDDETDVLNQLSVNYNGPGLGWSVVK